jgi:antitoxin VapB
MTAVTAKVFMSGRSQAIRLPAKLRLDTSEVRIERVGDGLYVFPAKPKQGFGEWLRGFYAQRDPLPADFLATRNDGPADTRDWDAFADTVAPPKKRRATAK